MADVKQKLIKQLNDLIALDFDAADAYETAVRRLDRDTLARETLTEFGADHLRHTVDLAACVRELGGTPAEKGDFMSLLTRGKVVLGSLLGDAKILAAMRSNEDTTNQGYDEALELDGLAAYPRVQEVLRRNRDDERRHRAWIVDRIEEHEQGRAAA